MSNECIITKDEIILACDNLRTYCDNKVLCNSSIVDIDGERTKNFYTLLTDSRRDGVVMNFCPFCGKDIKTLFSSQATESQVEQ